jgi:molybdopterin-guanine dinucleotide biosynthesis protein
MASTPVDPERIARAKVGYSVRRVDLRPPLLLESGPGLVPRHGDLVLAEVVTVGQHAKLELTTSRRAALYPGDEIVVAYGARYAPDQFEAELPDDLSDCDLAAAGGCAARVRSRHSAVREATRIRPVGLLAALTGRLNVAAGALPAPPPPTVQVPTLMVAGTAMNAGKTTTVASLAHGLSRAGLRVGAGKVTGTGAGGDRYCFDDAGAAEVLDFTDLGFVSTYRIPVSRLVRLAVDMHDHLVATGVDVVLLEVADGVLHGETCEVVSHPAVQERVDGAVFAAADAAGALLGVARMRECGQRVVAVSGLLTASPLATREAQARLDVPLYSSRDLCDPVLSTGLLQRITPARPSALTAATAP